MHLLQNSRGAHQDNQIFSHIYKGMTTLYNDKQCLRLPTYHTAWTYAPGKYVPSAVYVFFPSILSKSLSLLSNLFLSVAYTYTYVHIFMCIHTCVCIFGRRRNWLKFHSTQDWIPLHSLLLFCPIPGTNNISQFIPASPDYAADCICV